jgi:hypothetical protein
MSAKGCDITEPVSAAAIRVRFAVQGRSSGFAGSVGGCVEETD